LHKALPRKRCGGATTGTARELGLTFVLVTHDGAVARRAQRFAIMANGRLSVRQDTRRAGT
jgi:ABC-type lipoprotein export system ATPase subunit